MISAPIFFLRRATSTSRAFEPGSCFGAVDVFAEFDLRDRPSLVVHEIAQRAEFERRQGDPRPVDGRHHSARIDAQDASLEHRRRVAGGAADDSAEAGEQFLRLERLGQIIVGAGVDAGHAFRPGAARGQDQDRRRHARGAQVPDHRQSVEPRQAEVEDDAVEVLSLAAQPGLLAVAARLRRRSRLARASQRFRRRS